MTGPSMENDSLQIGESVAKVVLGDMTQISCDAYFVPEFNSGASYNGVGAAICRGGAEKGMIAYDDAVAEHGGGLEFGTVVLTPSYGGHSSHLLHGVTVGSGRDREFGVVQETVYSALKLAEQAGLTHVAAPALGTGVIGKLTAEQSAQAMFSALDQFASEGGKIRLDVVIYGDRDAFHAFRECLRNGDFRIVSDGVTGRKKLDLKAWEEEMLCGSERFADPDKNQED